MDPYSSDKVTLTSPGNDGATVAPSDTVDLATVARALYLGGTGDVKGILAGGTTPLVFSSVPAGSILPLRFKRVYATGTTATNLVAVY